MYRATLIFSYSFSLPGYYTYFWYPIPLSQLCLRYFLHFSASIPFFPLRPGYFLSFLASIPFLPLRLGYFLHFSASIPFFPLRLGYFLHFPTFHTLAILRFCVCRSLTIHRIAQENVFRNLFFNFPDFLCKIA